VIAPNIDTASAPTGAKFPTPQQLDELRARQQRKVLEFLAPLFARRDALLEVVAQEFKIPVSELTGGLSTYAALPARRVAVALTIENLCPPFTREVIAGFFNISDGTLYRFAARVKQWEAADADFAWRMGALRPRVREAIKLATEDTSNG